MTFSEFIRIYPLRATNLAWLFGAGTSISAGMPTASDLIWQFKRMIYCSEQGINPSLFSNLTDNAVRKQIQSYFDGLSSYPAQGSVEEYSFYFEKAFTSARDRSEYLSRLLSGMQNSYGHKVIGLLMQKGLLPIIFTTNFDKAFENTAVSTYHNTDAWFVATTDNADTAIQVYQKGFRPFITKLHGDYFSDKLKNTSEELQQQDESLRQILKLSCLSGGLAIMGYSGRDKSVMDVLSEVLNEPKAFPSGIFWFIRAGEKPLLEVLKFVDSARSKNIQAELVEIETFDTAWADIIKGVSLTAIEQEKIESDLNRQRTLQIQPTGTRFPVLRFNTIQVTEFPSNARVYSCQIGNTKEVRELIKTNNSDLIAVRKATGVVGFGADIEFEKVFGELKPISMDVVAITHKDLSETSSIKGMIADSIVQGFTRSGLLKARRKFGRSILFPNPTKITDSVFAPLLRTFPNGLIGDIPNCSMKWIVAVEISIQIKLNNVFLVVLPTVIGSKPANDAERFNSAAFIKESTARWYNKEFSAILDAWLDVIFEGTSKERIVYSHDPSAIGYIAKFKLQRKAAMSKSI